MEAFSGADAITPGNPRPGDGRRRKLGIPSGGPPRIAQRLPADERAPEREEHFVDVSPLVRTGGFLRMLAGHGVIAENRGGHFELTPAAKLLQTGALRDGSGLWSVEGAA